MIRHGRFIDLGRVRLVAFERTEAGVELHLQNPEDPECDGAVLVIEEGQVNRARMVAGAILGGCGALDPSRFSIPAPLFDVELSQPTLIEVDRG